MKQLNEYAIDSKRLGETRRVTVFLPPNYREERRDKHPVLFCTDGQAVPNFASNLQPGMNAGSIPPAILIGTHSHPANRANEYTVRANDERFAAHEEYFTDEILQWSREKFNIATNREACGVFGFSHGGAFALTMGMRHRDKYGLVIAFSIAGEHDAIAFDKQTNDLNTRYYLSAGTREKPLLKKTRGIARTLAKNGAEHVITSFQGGHDLKCWSTELPKAIRWAF